MRQTCGRSNRAKSSMHAQSANSFVVVGFAERSPAKKADIRNGDILMSVAAKKCATPLACSAASGRKAKPASKCR